MTATVFDIQRFSLHDGPGIRTTVFLKGCPLRCLWCHNPESKSKKAELTLYKNRCIGCLDCLSACPNGVHSVSPSGEHLLDRTRCLVCGACAAACTGALEVCGTEMRPEEVLEEVLKDLPFYENSGGGLTVSGGEPLLQAEFTYALLSMAKSRGLHTAIETSGYAPWETVREIAAVTDLFLWDVKETDPARHKAYTGVDNAVILENLRRLDAQGAKIVLRCPVIPGCNDREEHFAAVGKLAETLSAVEHVDIEPYHPLGISKADALGQEYPLRDLKMPENETVNGWCLSVAKHTAKPVRRS